MNKASATILDLKKNNRNRVYQYLYETGGKTLKALAEELNMSMPTVIQIIKQFKEERLVMEGKSIRSTGGRRARLLVCNQEVRYSVGVDITKHHVTFLVIDMRGSIIQSVRLKFPFNNEDIYFVGFQEQLLDFLNGCGIDQEKILGIGISIPGIISEDNRYMNYGGVIDFVGGDLHRFSEGVPYPCLFSNDANAGGYAELWREDKTDKAIYLSLSNSVGGSILINDTIYYGDNQKSAEFGHLTIVQNGRKCYCGRRGCVDAYCSASILEKSGGTLKDFFRKLKEGCPEQKAVWEDYKRHLVLTINNLRVCFDCQVILGGYVGSYLEDYLEEIKKDLEAYRLFDQSEDYVKICYYKREAAAVGAALQHVRRYIDEI